MEYDLAVIGAGWAGFNAALKAKEAGLKVCLIEASDVGGTCLNRGCIPTKTLIQSARVFNLTKKSLNFGIELQGAARVNFSKIQERKDKIIAQLRSGMQFLLKGIDFVNADAYFESNHQIKAGDKFITAKFILLASGSKPLEIGNLKFDGKKILSSDDILNLKELPGSLLIIGGGVIGCEFANLFSAFGTQVTIAEKMPQLIPGLDIDAAKKLETTFKKRGVKILLNIDATSINFNDYALVLLCVGRKANVDNLGLDKIGVKLEKGKIVTDEYLKTSQDNIYAAGDSTGKLMLAHFAAYQGITAAHNIAFRDKPKKADSFGVPSCIFTDPEVAFVGLSESEAKAKGIDIKINKFDFMASGMARIIDETEGFIKIISDNKTGIVLGACIIGPKATELISVLTLAVSNRLKISQIQETIFAHPTVSESIGEAVA